MKILKVTLISEFSSSEMCFPFYGMLVFGKRKVAFYEVFVKLLVPEVGIPMLIFVNEEFVGTRSRCLKLR